MTITAPHRSPAHQHYQSAVDLGHASAEVLADLHLPASAPVGGMAAAGAVVLGMHQLGSPSTEVKVEGLSNLALAGSLYANLAAGHHPSAGTYLACAHGVIDLGLAAHFLRHEDGEAALLNAVKGVTALGAAAFPSAAPALHTVLLAASVYQAARGYTRSWSTSISSPPDDRATMDQWQPFSYASAPAEQRPSAPEPSYRSQPWLALS